MRAWAIKRCDAIIIGLWNHVVSNMQYSFNLALNNEDDTQNLAQVLAQHFSTGVVYLMGRVSQREADIATEITRGVSGVVKVVRSFEIISEEEAKQK